MEQSELHNSIHRENKANIIKGCIAARNEPANALLVKHWLAAMSGSTHAKLSRRACEQDHPGLNTLGL